MDLRAGEWFSVRRELRLETEAPAGGGKAPLRRELTAEQHVAREAATARRKASSEEYKAKKGKAAAGGGGGAGDGARHKQ